MRKLNQVATRQTLVWAAVSLASVLIAGCAGRDSVKVGSVPDDYRTNHPIIVGEKERSIDIPVAASSRSSNRGQRATVAGFLSHYDKQAGSILGILVPQGSSNSYAAGAVAREFAQIARQSGVPDSSIVISTYQAGSSEVSAPIRLSYSSVAAYTAQKCGRWPKDIHQNPENKHYANFGCSNQNNLAAQVANPTDLLGPRQSTEIDAENRGNVIDDYREVLDEWSPETEY